MKNTMTLQTVFSGRVFDIPDYQRGYAWETQQVDEFWEDIQSLHPKRLHYAGTIALFESDAAPTTMDNEGNHYTRSEVVDGQQRLTTVVILLNEIARALRSLDEHDTLAQGITKNFIRATGMHGLPLYKLNLNQETDQFFKDHVLPDAPQDIAGPLVAASTRLRNARERLALRLSQGPEDHAERQSWLTSLYEKITSSLRFNRFEIEDPTDVGLIFEVVNDRGKSLSDLEKVKNFLLYTASRLGIDEVSKKQFADAVNDTWKAILTNLSQADLDSAANENQLLRSHWIMEYDPQPHNWRGAKSIKERLDPGHMDTGEALQQLFDYLSSLRNSCVAYCDFLKPNRTDAFNIFPANSRGEVKAWNQRLARIGVTATFLPLFIAIRKRWPEDPAPYLETLRGCLKSWGACQAAEHESGHSGVDPGFGGFRQCFIILAQSPVPAQPGESALHHPASGQHLKAVAVPGTPHYLQSPTRQCRHPLDQLSGVAAICPDQAQPGKPSGQLADDQLGPIPVLHVGWVHRHRQQQSLGIHHNMPFAAFHLLARVVPPRPPFSVVFTDWLSMMAPLGLGWRPRNRRIVGSRAS